MPIARTILLSPLVLIASGCWQACAQGYLNRTDTITTSAGDAQDVNSALQIIDPWPRHVGNRRIPGNGERLSGAVQRYRSPPALGGAAGTASPQGAPAAPGAPPPQAPSSSAATPPATLPF